MQEIRDLLGTFGLGVVGEGGRVRLWFSDAFDRETGVRQHVDPVGEGAMKIWYPETPTRLDHFGREIVERPFGDTPGDAVKWAPISKARVWPL
ncbi:MAG: hypothetical protein ACOC0P_01565 [Planctomycetota bacterium]